MPANAIVLRNIPKSDVRLDLFRCPVQGGFRGFCSDFPMIGWHYVRVTVDQEPVGFWCHLALGQAVVRVFDPTHGFVEDEPESAQHYAQLALNGGMQPALMPYPDHLYARWFGLVSAIKAPPFLPPLYGEDVGTGSRFENALQGSHAGNPDALLAEFQYAFARWLISLDGDRADQVAFDRWQHLLLAACGAGESRIRASSPFFAALPSILMRQVDLLPREWFTADSELVQHLNYLIEDMIDSEVDGLGDRAQTLAHFLETHFLEEAE